VYGKIFVSPMLKMKFSTEISSDIIVSQVESISLV